MPRANEVGKPRASIQVKIPTKAHPHLKRLVHELDFACSTCSSAYQQPTYRTFYECWEAGALLPINGPGNTFSRFGLLCPECNTAPEQGPFIENGIIDLLTVPPNYKRPERPTGSGTSLFEDEDEDADAPVLKPVPQAPKGPQKKASDLHPKTTGKSLKGNKLAATKAGKTKKSSKKAED
jgi:hypothetical protein